MRPSSQEGIHAIHGDYRIPLAFTRCTRPEVDGFGQLRNLGFRRLTTQFTRRGRCNGVVARENRMRPRSECNALFGGCHFLRIGTPEMLFIPVLLMRAS